MTHPQLGLRMRAVDQVKKGDEEKSFPGKGRRKKACPCLSFACSHQLSAFYCCYSKLLQV